MNEWDRIAESWNRLRKRPLREIYYLLSMVEWKGRVAGIGEGNGRNLIPFRQAGFMVVNVDSSYEMLKNWDGIGILASAESLPLPDSSFDVAISINAIHCIRTKKGREKAMEEIARILKPGGWAMVSAWNRFEKRFLPRSILFPDVEVPWKTEEGVVKRFYHLFTKGELISLSRKAGLEVIEAFKGFDSKESWFVIAKK